MIKIKYRIWWIPQVPGEPFFYPVSSIAEGDTLTDCLARYDLFLYGSRIRDDYTNTGGIEYFDPDDKINSPEGSWVDVEETDES